MTIWNIDLIWALMLLGVALFTSACLIMNPMIRAVRIMGIGVAYAEGIWMAVSLPWTVAITTWCIFAAFGGVLSFAYELWARRRYASVGRPQRPLVLLEGFILWPTMIPDAIEGMLVDAGVLEPGGRPDHTAEHPTVAPLPVEG